jgi:hypothetical protein
MTPKGADLEATDLIEVSTIESGSYVTRSITGQELIDAIPLPPTGLTVGTTPISSGTIGRVLFQGTGNVLQQSSQLSWDNSTNALTLTTGKIFSGYNSGGSASDALKLELTGGGAVLGIQNSNASGFSGVEYLSNAGVPRVFTGFNNGNGQEFRFNNFATNGYIDFLIGGTSGFRLFTTRNVGINTTTDAGFRLDVNGTARVQNDLSVSRNQNNPTKIAVSNTTAGNNSFVEGGYASDSSSGECKIGKYSSTTSAYKIITASNAYLYNGTIAGDIAILNDFATGRIKFATGGVSTAQMTLFSTGNLGINTTTDAGFKLDVNGTARVATSILVGSSSTQGTIQTGVFRGTFFNDYANNFTIFQVQTSGNVSFYNSVAIGTTSAPSASKLRVVGLPTSSAGLSSGDVWNDGGTLKIV